MKPVWNQRCLDQQIHQTHPPQHFDCCSGVEQIGMVEAGIGLVAEKFQ